MADLTIRQGLVMGLVRCGLLDDQAREIVTLLAGKPEQASMQGRWDQPMSAYPEAVFLTVWMSCRWAAVEWIDANVPDAWYRPVFVDV